MKKWSLSPVQNIPPQLEMLGLNPITTRLLLQRGLTDKKSIDDFFHGRYEDLGSPLHLSGIPEAIQRIKKAAKKSEKVAIFGDYDADGLTSSVLLKETLEQIGISANVYIPDRNKEGYGLNKNAVDFLQKEYGTSLIITVDCGISNRDEIIYARKKGIETIVVDHHAIPKQIPEDCILINPKLMANKDDLENLAGVGVVFKLVQAIFENFLPQKKEQLKWALDLVAIGTIADCVPLLGENRIISKFGLIVLQKTKRIGLQEIIQVARVNIDEKHPPRAESVAFQIGPRLNASGRVDHADLAFNLLSEKDRSKARIIALEVEQKNSERQKISQQVYAEVKKTIDENREYRIIVRKDPHWPLGIVGIVAGKIADEYHCPVFLFREGDDILEGSGRSIDAFDIVSAANKIDNLIEKYGGHAQAMGLKIRPENFSHFENKMEAMAIKSFKKNPWRKKIPIDAEITPDDIDWDIFSEISKFEPFGEGNREPIFLSKNLKIRNLKLVGNGQKHLKFIFEAGNSKIVEGIYFKQGDRYSSFSPGDAVSVAFNLRSNEWNGNSRLELHIIDMEMIK